MMLYVRCNLVVVLLGYLQLLPRNLLVLPVYVLKFCPMVSHWPVPIHNLLVAFMWAPNFLQQARGNGLPKQANALPYLRAKGIHIESVEVGQ